jgi:hypothetical protein
MYGESKKKHNLLEVVIGRSKIVEPYPSSYPTVY